MNRFKRFFEIIKVHPLASAFTVEMVFVIVASIALKLHKSNNWTAIEAIGTWVCGLIIPFAVIWVQKIIDENEKRTGASNAATIDEIKKLRGEEKAGREITDQKVYNIIKIRIVVTSEEIADELGVDVSKIEDNLRNLYANNKIWNLNGFGNLRKSVEGCKWKIR